MSTEGGCLVLGGSRGTADLPPGPMWDRLAKLQLRRRVSTSLLALAERCRALFWGLIKGVPIHPRSLSDSRACQFSQHGFQTQAEIVVNFLVPPGDFESRGGYDLPAAPAGFASRSFPGEGDSRMDPFWKGTTAFSIVGPWTRHLVLQPPHGWPAAAVLVGPAKADPDSGISRLLVGPSPASLSVA